MSTAARAPRFYFSLRSPYSWLLYRDLLKQYPDLAERLEWIPFWEPDEPSTRLLTEAGGEFAYADMSKAKHLYVLQDVRRLAAERGLSVSWPIDREPWWEVPHLAYVVARRAGRGRAFIDAAYRLRWEQGADICDPATVADLAATIGLDPAPLVSAPQDPSVRAEGVQALLSAYRDGVFGVPFLVDRFDRYWGLDRLPTFVADQARKAPSTKPSDDLAGASLKAGSDAGHAGGCG